MGYKCEPKSIETGKDCVNDYDCGDVATKACNKENKCKTVEDAGVKCISKNQCKIGSDCVDGLCKEGGASSLLAFPRTLYGVQCKVPDQKEEFSFVCSLEFTVPKFKNASTFSTSPQTEEFLIQEVNARFKPTTLDFVKTENAYLKKAELYDVKISSDDIIEIDGVKLTTTVEPPVETSSASTTSTEIPEGSGEGSGDTTDEPQSSTESTQSSTESTQSSTESSTETQTETTAKITTAVVTEPAESTTEGFTTTSSMTTAPTTEMPEGSGEGSWDITLLQ